MNTLTKEERKKAIKLADQILQKPKKRCRHVWVDTNIHDTSHWWHGEKSQSCDTCGKERWIKIKQSENG
jgi:ribosome recycling factor